MEKSLLSLLRRELKARIYHSRTAVWTPRNGFSPICPICGNSFDDYAPDMHEAIITRGDVRGNADLTEAIMVKENCVLVHPGDCHIKATSQDGKYLCIRQLIQYETYTSIKEWLMDMNDMMKGNQAANALNLLQEVYDDMSELPEGTSVT